MSERSVGQGLSTSYASEDDLDEIAVLFEEAFGKPPEMKRLSHYYFNGPRGRARNMVLRNGVREIIGHSALFPVELRIGNALVPAGFTIGSMTKPGSVGLLPVMLKNLERDTYDDFKILFGFPNENSVDFFTKRFAWEALEPIQHWSLQGSSRPANGDDLSLAALSAADELGPAEFDALLLKFNALFAVNTSRDIDYLKWRYFDHPLPYSIWLCKGGERYRGLVVTKIFVTESGKRVLDIIDVIFDDWPLFGPLVAAVLNVQDEPYDEAECWVSNSAVAAALGESGFQRNESSTSFCIKVNGDVPMFGDTRTLRDAWYLMKGDSDVY